jgi:Trk K+ transport system NAD-binding subunit
MLYHPGMKKNRFVLIGLGHLGQELLKRLAAEVELTVVEVDPELEQVAQTIRVGAVQFIAGDATSRLVLEKAGVNEADGVIVTTTTEEVNLEVARVLREQFEPRRIVSIGITREGVKAFEEMGVEVVDIIRSGVTELRNAMEQTVRTVQGIGLGENEIVEVEVHPHSKLAGKALGSIAPINWRVGLIYRDKQIVMPRKDAVLKAGDRVVLLGDPQTLAMVSEIFTFSFTRFPLEYGPVAAVYLGGAEDEAFFEELAYIFRVFPMKRAVFIHSADAQLVREKFERFITKENFRSVEQRAWALSPLSALKDLFKERKWELGLIVFSRLSMFGRLGAFRARRGRKGFFLTLADMAPCPVVLLGGTFPYEKVALPLVGGLELHHIFGTAIEISLSLESETEALLVNPSEYISSEEDVQEFEGMKKAVSDMSLTYKRSVNSRILSGNPVEAMAGAVKDYNCLLVDAGGWKRQGWLRDLLDPDVLWQVMKRSPLTSFLVPPLEESL